MDLNTNERQIKSVAVWQPGGEQVVNAIRFSRLNDYSFRRMTGQVRWEILQINSDTKIMISSGLMMIPSEVLQQWIDDDSVIYNYIMEQLNVQEI